MVLYTNVRSYCIAGADGSGRVVVLWQHLDNMAICHSVHDHLTGTACVCSSLHYSVCVCVCVYNSLSLHYSMLHLVKGINGWWEGHGLGLGNHKLCRLVPRPSF